MDGVTGPTWIKSFKKRHLKLAIRIPKAMDEKELGICVPKL